MQGCNCSFFSWKCFLRTSSSPSLHHGKPNISNRTWWSFGTWLFLFKQGCFFQVPLSRQKMFQGSGDRWPCVSHPTVENDRHLLRVQTGIAEHLGRWGESFRRKTHNFLVGTHVSGWNFHPSETLLNWGHFYITSRIQGEAKNQIWVAVSSIS